jgi:hypothetical protein
VGAAEDECDEEEQPQADGGAPAPFDRVTVTGSRTDFTMKLGGGIDVRVGRRVNLRLIELNYNPIFGGESALDVSAFPGNLTRTLGRTSHNFSIGVGIVFH